MELVMFLSLSAFQCYRASQNNQWRLYPKGNETLKEIFLFHTRNWVDISVYSIDKVNTRELTTPSPFSYTVLDKMFYIRGFYQVEEKW